MDYATYTTVPALNCIWDGLVDLSLAPVLKAYVSIQC
jgi:hypothetical protein